MHLSKRTRLLILIATTAAVLALSGCAEQGKESMEDAPTAVADERPTAAPTATPRQVGVSILANGVIRATNPPLPVQAQASGQLREMRVGPGNVVSAGDTIAVLDDTLAQEQVAAAELELRRAEINLAKLRQDPDAAQLAASRAGLASAQAELIRLTEPPKQERVDAARASLQAAQASLEALLASGEPGSSEIEIAERQLEQTKNGLWSAQISRDTSCGQVGRGGSQAACDAGNASVNSAEESVRIAEINLNKVCQGPEAQAVASARAQVASTQAEMDSLLAGTSAESIAAAQANVDQAKASLDNLLAGASAEDIALAEMNVQQAQASLDSAQRNLERTTIIAPADGTVASVDVAVGGWLANGSPVVVLQDLDHLEFVTLNLSERDVALIEPGQTAVVSLKAYPAEEIEATVARVSAAPGEMVGDAATFPVVLELPNVAFELLPGMTGRVEIQGD